MAAQPAPVVENERTQPQGPSPNSPAVVNRGGQSEPNVAGPNLIAAFGRRIRLLQILLQETSSRVRRQQTPPQQNVRPQQQDRYRSEQEQGLRQQQEMRQRQQQIQQQQVQQERSTNNRWNSSAGASSRRRCSNSKCVNSRCGNKTRTVRIRRGNSNSNGNPCGSRKSAPRVLSRNAKTASNKRHVRSGNRAGSNRMLAIVRTSN